MKTAVSLLVLLLLTTFLAGFAAAQELIIYPSKGQSQEQMEQDKFSCYSWAKQQTGFDPMEVPKATAPPPKQEAKKGGLLRGATRGAAVGVAAGAIAGDAGKGAAIGAASGGLIGGMRRRDQAGRQQQAEQQWAQEQSAQYAHRRNEYNRAYAACLEGKGYTVK
ncbi:MAG: glycine zipper domain-containing protein [Syntrophobacteria bacterium]